MNEYFGIAVSFVLAGGIAAAMVVLGSTLGKKNPTPAKLAPFECGVEPFALPMGRLAIKFYLIAILFILALIIHVLILIIHILILIDNHCDFCSFFSVCFEFC